MHSIVAWERLAEICGEYLKKGSRVYFEGSLQTRQWEDKDGQTQNATEIKVRDLIIFFSGHNAGWRRTLRASAPPGYRGHQGSRDLETAAWYQGPYSPSNPAHDRTQNPWIDVFGPGEEAEDAYWNTH